MRPLFVLLVFLPLAAALPAGAQSPTTPASPANSSPVSAVAPAAAGGPPASLLDSLIGRKQIVGLTKQDGTRYLCRVNSGDHGVYIVQKFHFAGPPRAATETERPAPDLTVPYYKTVTVGSGRDRQRFRVLTDAAPGPAPRSRRVRTESYTTIPDQRAVSLLLAGVAGANRSPREIEAERDMLAPSDVKCIQILSPPAAPPITPAAAMAGASPVAGSAAATSSAPASAWTLTTLWPTSAGSQGDAAARRLARTRRRSRLQQP